MKHSKITVGMVTLLTAASVLAGCTTDTATPQTPDATPGVTTTTQPGDNDPTPGATGSAAPTDTATTSAPVEVKAGDKLTKKDLDNLPEGVAGYKLPGGKIVAVESDKPLPKAVVKDAESRSTPAKGMRTGVAQAAANSQLQWDLSQETGKEIILIARTLGMSRTGTELENLIIIYGDRELNRSTPDSGWTLAGAKKYALSWIAKQADPELYELVIQP